MKLSDRQWREFKVEDIFDIFNLKPYHKKDLLPSNDHTNSIPYVTRTNKDNGLEDIVKNCSEFKTNPANIIIFGAENATFFYQPFEHIAGNKMYGMKNNNINKYTGLFLQQVLNSSVKDCGFGYGQGLTGTRERKRSVMLPVSKTDENLPDWDFMDKYVREQLSSKLNRYKEYVQSTTQKIKYNDIIPLNNKKWGEFIIGDLFNISIGKNVDGNKVDKTSGKTPYITRKESNNGLDGFIDNDTRKLNVKFPVITIGNETARPFVQKYPFYTGTKVNILEPIADISDEALQFIAVSLHQHKSKYNFSYTINSTRLKKQKIMLPVNSLDEPDYEYMEQYIKNIILKKYNDYLYK